MGVLSAIDIYHAALSAGFPADKAVTWTAIALAESGGRADAHAGHGENSWGLWQINVASGVRDNRWGDLTDPVNNARAAFEISGGGRDMSPWTTTHASHAGTGADYRTYRVAAEAAGGGSVHGDWAGVSGYGDHGSGAGSFDQIDAGVPISAVTATAPALDSDHDGLMDAFEAVAGTNPHEADTDHDGLSDGFEASVSHTDPLSADTDHDGVPDAVEWARGTDAGHLAGVAGVAGSGALQQSVRGGVLDSDHDGLSDRYEAVLGTDPHQTDTDHDGLPDGLEHALGTDPLQLDTDRDGLSDGLEHAAGTDPGRAAPAEPVSVASAGPGAAARGPAPVAGTPAGTRLGDGAGPGPGPGTGAAPGDGRVHDFLQAALAQRGDHYVFGATVSNADPDPRAFDCSKLTRWAAHRAGVTLPDGAAHQFVALEQQGALIPVEQAIHTPGALLFHFASAPSPGGGEPAVAHVAISLGNGQTIEALGRAYGVNEFSAANRFNYAAVIPGLQTAGQADAARAASFDQIDAGAPVGSSSDSDHDGLTDGFEAVAGTDPHQADTDHDGLSDGFEASVSHTDPLSADTDHDGVPDAVEWARGTDAGHLAGVAGVAGVGALQQSVRGGVLDSDHDGLSDRYETVLGTDPHQADTDHDGLPDGLEHALGTDPLLLDTDGDGLSDGLEHAASTDPLHAASAYDTAAGSGDGHGSAGLLVYAHDVGGH